MGQTGWTGDLCQAETIGIATQTVASHETQSGHLPGSAWRCFVMSTPPDAEWHYLAVELKHTYPEGDPDLYGLFVNATHPTYPSGTTRGYDFREISSSSYRTVTVTARKEEHHRDATGVYLCIEAYGDHNTTFELQAAFSECPAAFVSPPGASRDAGGIVSQCSSFAGDAQPAGTCDESTGKCACREYDDHTYLPPDGDDGGEGDAVPTESLGFESCSARVDFARDDDASSSWTNQSLAPGAWHFYAFTSREDDYQTVVTLTRGETSGAEPRGGGRASAYLRHETLPDHRWGHRDLPTSYADPDDATQEMILTRGDAHFAPGTWYVGVFAGTGDSARYDLSVQKYDCPKNCSDRGRCVREANGTRSCACDVGPSGPYLLEDCSEEFTAWEKDGAVYAVNGTLRSSEYDYFALPELDARERRRRIELVLTAEYDREDPPYYWQPERPTLLLKNGDSRHDFPTMDNYTFKVTMETKMRKYSVELCASQFNLGAGLWQAAIYNPVRVEPMRYWVTFEKRGVCPSANDQECSGHGTCHAGDAADPDFATCRCDEGWTSSDCNFRTCAEGSFVVSSSPDAQHRACFRECRDGKHRTEGCDAVTCNPPARPATVGEDVVCVLDECARDEFRAAKDGSSCVVRCAPAKEDGPEGARRLESACDPETVRKASRSDGGAARVFGVFFLVCAVAGAATAAGAAAWRAGVFDGVRERVGRAVSGDGYRRRYDPYEDDDDFARADDFLERPL